MGGDEFLDELQAVVARAQAAGLDLYEMVSRVEMLRDLLIDEAGEGADA